MKSINLLIHLKEHILIALEILYTVNYELFTLIVRTTEKALYTCMCLNLPGTWNMGIYLHMSLYLANCLFCINYFS